MNEVVDRPPVIDRPPVEDKKDEATKPPQKYTIEAWAGGHVCVAKVMATLIEVFEVPMPVASKLVEVLRYNRRAPVALGLSKDMAESKAAKAEAFLNDMVGDCTCGHRMKFTPVPE